MERIRPIIVDPKQPANSETGFLCSQEEFQEKTSTKLPHTWAG